MDSQGNIIIADMRRIRQLSTDGTVSTIAGSGDYGHLDGRVEVAQFVWCEGVAVGEDGTIFVSEAYHVIRKISNGLVTTLAGKSGERGNENGKGDQARFSSPRGMCVDSDGSLLVADSLNLKIRRVSMDRVVSVFAGTGEKGEKDGDLSEADFTYPTGICRNGKDLYVVDGGRVRKISEGKVVTLCSGGVNGICFFNGQLYTTSSPSHKIFEGEELRHIAGTGEKGHKDGPLLESLFDFPHSIVGSNGSLYVSDRNNYCIRRILLIVEWSPQNHQRCDRKVRYAVRTLFLMRKRNGTLFNQLPREILPLICTQIH